VLLSKFDHLLEAIVGFRGGIFQGVKVSIVLAVGVEIWNRRGINVNLGIVDAARCQGRFFVGLKGNK